MRSDTASDREAIQAAYDELDAAFDKVLGLSFDALTHPELLALMNRRETLYRRQPAVDHRIINRLAAEADLARSTNSPWPADPTTAWSNKAGNPKTKRWPYRMDPATAPRHRPNPGE